MRLLDCFVELIAYMAYFIKMVPPEQPAFHKVKSDIMQLIDKSRQHPYRARCTTQDFDLAQFAIFAWIDEVILNSQWQEKQQWQGEQLQRLHYQTVDAGELFYDRLNTLDPGQLEVREVYYLCLAMGFCGRFCNPGDNLLLDQLKVSNLRHIAGNATDLSSYVNSPLFPAAYQDEERAPLIEKTRKRRFPVEIVAGIGGPAALYALLFVVYYFILDNVGQHFISMVP